MVNDLDLAGVYRITCVPTGKVYIGSTTHFRRRFYEHRYSLRKNKHFNRHLQSAFNLYGEEAFLFDPIMICDREDRVGFEQIGIKVFAAYTEGFNNTPIAVTSNPKSRKPGPKRGPRPREQYLNRNKTYLSNPEFKKNMSEKMKGVWEERKRNKELYESVIKNMSGSMKGRKLSPEHRKKVVNAMRARHGLPPKELIDD